MIKVENDYESVIYEQPFPSHIYENQSEFLQNYYTTPINSHQQRKKQMRLTLQIKPIKTPKQNA